MNGVRLMLGIWMPGSYSVKSSTDCSVTSWIQVGAERLDESSRSLVASCMLLGEAGG
jgi:hypothetical protein